MNSNTNRTKSNTTHLQSALPVALLLAEASTDAGAGGSAQAGDSQAGAGAAGAHLLSRAVSHNLQERRRVK